MSPHVGDPRPGGDRGAQGTVLPRDAGVTQLPATARGWWRDTTGQVEVPGGDDGLARGLGVLRTASPVLWPHHLTPHACSTFHCP